MIPSFLLSLREGFEAALILGIVFSALDKINRRHLTPMVWGGAVAAAALSIIAAGFLYSLGARIEGQAEAIFEGLGMLIAAILLTWMIFWTRRQARVFAGEIEGNVVHAATSGGGRAMFLLAFITISREGLELALFLVISTFNSNGLQTVLGAVAGLITAAFLGFVLFSTTRRLNLRRFFFITSLLLILFSAGLVAQSVHEFIEAGTMPSIIGHVWDINRFLDKDSALGIVLHSLLGYNGSPSLVEVLAYLGYFLFVGSLFRIFALPVGKSVRINGVVKTSSK